MKSLVGPSLKTIARTTSLTNHRIFPLESGRVTPHNRTFPCPLAFTALNSPPHPRYEISVPSVCSC
jgi:hypothetical protein